jgi:SNF2 family DNA or RNA helicase
MLRQRNFALFMEMRLGKTFTTIRRIKLIKECKRNLIVCPYSAFTAWKDELIREEEPEPVELVGTRSQRLKLLQERS